MLINFAYKFLFVHIQKTAGTSITEILNSIPGTKRILPNHCRLLDYNGDLSGLFKFAFVRNPWERLVSWYAMMLSKMVHNSFSNYLLSNSNSFSEFLDLTEIILETDVEEHNKFNIQYYKSIGFNQLDYLCDKDGKISVDFIGKFENLEKDFNSVITHLGFQQVLLPYLNKSEHNDYRCYYNDRDKEKVARLYQRDIEYFGYQF